MSTGKDKCQAVGCYKPATWAAIPNTVTDPHMADTLTCDEHLVDIGLTVPVDVKPAEAWVVYPHRAEVPS